jgi:hypothetical protein
METNFRYTVVSAYRMKKYTLLTFYLVSSVAAYGQAGVSECDDLTADIQIQKNLSNPIEAFVDKHRKIGSIENSKSEFEIRYYFSPSLTNGGSVVIINCLQGELVARKVYYWFNSKKSMDKRKVKKVKVVAVQPTSSWTSFINSLRDLEFFTLPTMSEIRPKMKKHMALADGRTVEKRVAIMDGALFTYQIKVGDKIRMFSYHSPMAWYRTYDHVEELRLAGDIKDHFAQNLVEVE